MSQDYNYALSTADLLPVPGNTPFGYYDNDPVFQNDAQRACFYITRRLGFGVVDVELVDFQIYAAIEEAVTTYGNEVYLYKVRENYLSIEGSETDSFLCDYNVSYFNASMSFSPVSIATAADFSGIPEMQWAIESGSVFYIVSASVIPSMSRADFSLVKSFGIQNQCGNFLPQYTYIKGGVIYFTITNPTDFIDPNDQAYVLVEYVDNNYLISNQPTTPTTQVVQYIAYKSDYNMNTRLIDRSLGGTIRIANNYADQAFIRNIPVYSASIDLIDGQQVYDLKDLFVSQSFITMKDNPVVVRVFYQPPPAQTMAANPWPGLGGVGAVADSWGFYGGYGYNSYIQWPVYFDIQRIQEWDMQMTVRYNGYSFSVNDNKLTVFPIPPGNGHKLWIEFAKESDVLQQNKNLNSNVEPYSPQIITDVSNVPYANPTYSRINSIGKSWIMRYTLALSKEILGYSRGKYPQADVPKIGAMASGDLFTDARAEKAALLEELRMLLDETSKQKQLERQAAEDKANNEIMVNIPLPSPIYIL
jgi:hypothetical protein